MIATQNPIGSAGTQMLPDSQLDRFMICTSLGYPDVETEIEIIKHNNGQSPLDGLKPVVNCGGNFWSFRRKWSRSLSMM